LLDYVIEHRVIKLPKRTDFLPGLPRIALNSAEGQILDWLPNYLTVRIGVNALHLRYGNGDRFAAGHSMLATRLPNQNVLTVVRVHDWKTSLSLWVKLLDMLPFGIAAGAQ